MSYPRGTDTIGIRNLGFRWNWNHLKQGNDTMGSERSILSKVRIIHFLSTMVNFYVGILMHVVAEN